MALKKKTPRQTLKSLSWTYIILAVIGVIFAIVFALIPNINEIIKEHIDVENPLLYCEVTIIVNILIYVWYFYLSRRLADGKSKGYLYIVLLLLGVAGGIIGFTNGATKAISSIDFIIAVVALYFIYKIKKEDK
jgi:hypothetical protein